MGNTIFQKILLNTGSVIHDNVIKINVEQTLTQDATGTMVYLQLESLGIDKIKTKLSVSYVDHNTLQNGFENFDDHLFLQSVASKYGIMFSKAGNGVCHQVHLERFAKPGTTLIGSDSHTPTSGGMGCIAIGAGGLDVACAMAGRPFTIQKPKIINVYLTNKLNNGVAPKDVILYLLKIMTVKGGVNKVIEYGGPGVKTLSVSERATICNMGAELGVTTSIFPADEVTYDFLCKQGREKDYQELSADVDAKYDEVIEIDLSTIIPLAACPYSPDNISTIKELENVKVNQVLIGSCTNSSYEDFIKVASILKGRKINPNVSFGIAPGSKQVLEMITESGILSIFLQSGARILESACGACIGMGQAPNTDGVSLRTFNRNFYGRSGTLSAKVYLVSPETAAASAIKGYITSAEEYNLNLFDKPLKYFINDSLLVKPTFCDNIYYGPNIKALPVFNKLPKEINNKVIIKVDDNITTDHIMPAGAKVLPFRSNIERISDFAFINVDKNFKENCLNNNGGVIVAGENYGQGSSREHAAIVPRYLGITCVLAKSFARIHRQNLINFGILPIVISGDVYNDIKDNDEIRINDLDKINNQSEITIYNVKTNAKYNVKLTLTSEELEIIKCGGLLNYVKEGNYE